MAASCSGVRNDSDPIPPEFLSIALWVELAVLPFLRVPWHPEQYWV